jgi:hypothetical protein
MDLGSRSARGENLLYNLETTEVKHISYLHHHSIHHTSSLQHLIIGAIKPNRMENTFQICIYRLTLSPRSWEVKHKVPMPIILAIQTTHVAKSLDSLHALALVERGADMDGVVHDGGGFPCEHGEAVCGFAILDAGGDIGHARDRKGVDERAGGYKGHE